MNILVTGADRGLGQGMVKLLLSQGHQVIAGEFCHEWSQLGELQEAYSDTLTIIPLDVSSDESVANARRLVQEKFSLLDVIISNAGIHKASPDMNTDYAMMQNIYNVNAVGSVRVVEAFYDMMKDSDRKEICLVSSEAGSISRSWRKGEYGYCMSKAALNMYGKNLHNRLKPECYDIRLYYPGWVRSYMAGSLASQGELSIDEAAQLAIDYFLGNDAEDELLMVGFDKERWTW